MKKTKWKSMTMKYKTMDNIQTNLIIYLKKMVWVKLWEMAAKLQNMLMIQWQTKDNRILIGI